MIDPVNVLKQHETLNSINIGDLVQQGAAQSPKKSVIAAPNRTSLPYQKLQLHLSQVKAYLRSHGIRQQDTVAMVLPNGPEMATAFLAVAASATCAPLNPTYRAAEFEFYFSDLNPQALLIQSDIASAAKAVALARGITVIELTPDYSAEAGIFTLNSRIMSSDSRESQPAHGQAVTPNSDDIALVLHTSGTTAQPKIVPLTHQNLLVSADNIANILHLTADDKYLNILSLFHIHGLSLLLASLKVAGQIICTPGFDESQFFTWLEALQPTWYSAVPTMHHAIVEKSKATNAFSGKHTLRLVRSASAPLPLALSQDLENLFAVPVIEAYGATEAAPQIASNPLPPDRRKSGSVGQSAGPEVAIMGESGDLLAIGQRGEVVIRGANVMKGYLNNPQANARAFANGWFRTGDLGYFDQDNYLFIQGRLKEIINRGGEKIAPQEIDTLLLTLPDILESATFSVPHASLGEDIATVVIVKSDSSLTGPEIRQFLFERLADFKVPSQVITVDAIPKGPTGKVQRLDLAAFFADKLTQDYQIPTNQIDRIITDIFAEVLSVNRVGIHDNFFRLGGDSLKGIQAIYQINQAFTVEMNPILLFQRPTAAELSKEIAQLIEGKERQLDSALDELEHMSEEEVLRLLGESSSP